MDLGLATRIQGRLVIPASAVRLGAQPEAGPVGREAETDG